MTGLGGRQYGRQPWTVSGMLPTHLSASTLNIAQVAFSPQRLRAVLQRIANRRTVFDDQIRPSDLRLTWVQAAITLRAGQR